MLKIYNKDNNTTDLIELKEFTPGCWIDLIKPTEQEIQRLISELGVKEDFIKYILDDDELPRIEIEGDQKIIFIDVPYKKSKRNFSVVDTIPLAILELKDGYIITVSLTDTEALDDFKLNKVKEFTTNKRSRFIIQILYRVSILYLKYLKNINSEIELAEDKMFKATKNKDLAKLLVVEKSLVYITTSLKSNKVVLDKIDKGNIIQLFDADLEVLDDAMIENDQSIEMANLYRDILGSMTDSFATIISNNLNVIMKFLAGITIVLSIPTMVASFMGMNVPLGDFASNNYAFLILIVISVIFSLLVAFVLKRKNML
ncbi:MAG: magnesium transporter CorA family protein [Bacilli bacterium]|nr:magnesium transporter CorA family protein [Bacilli bacterium]